MSKYSHILFDHDGVLVDTEPLYFRATRSCIEELGIELSQYEHLVLMAEGRNTWELARQVGVREVEVERARRRRNSLYREFLTSEPIDIEGAEEVLAELSHCYRIAIVTTALPEDFDLIHQNRNIVSKVDFVVTRDAYENSKPHPDPYLVAMDKFGIGPEVALAVEDSERGLRSATAAGIDCAVVHNEFTASQDLSEASYRIQRLSDLLPQVLNQP
ncbi:MAG: HAD-IA family hydrolase [Gammaproteobacteria bacterium]|nr:HAD-IA family hydrolase [Gammaproteobacteria bacterium]